MRRSPRAVFLLVLGAGILCQGSRACAQDSIKSVRIGTQVWMAENLNVDRFRNGDPIPEARTAAEWAKAGKDQTPAWSCYDNNPDNCTKYGKLYNWYAVNDPRGLAPAGWHVPTKSEGKRDQVTGKYQPEMPLAEFDILEAAAGSLSNGLKAIGQGSGNGAGTNATGFSALLAGGRNSDGSFTDIGKVALLVSVSEDSDTAYARLLMLYYTVAGQVDYFEAKSAGFSVRCIRDWQQDAKAPATPLEMGHPAGRQMRRSDVHTYEVTLAAGEFLRVVFAPHGLNLFARVVGPDGRQASEAAPNGARRPDTVDVAAKTSGRYLVGVLVADTNATSGGYDVRITERLTAAQHQAWLVEERAKAATAERTAQGATQAWLASHAIRLRTVEAGNGFDDMQPLKTIVGNAHVVALGEATHGTREFFKLKHRMLEFLVTQMGFTVFGIEATMPEAYAVNDYVLTGKGDPARALAGLYFWTWNTEEVLDMIRWMRQYNADPKHLKKVKFYGFDMQAAPFAVKRTLSYLRRVDPEQAAAAGKALGPLANPIVDSVFLKAPADERAAMLREIDAVLAGFDARKSEYIGKSSEREWAVARQHASIVAQNLTMRNSATPFTSSVRDSSMAANIRWILGQEGPGTKMVVWAHNGHVNTEPAYTESYVMGSSLHKAFGADMVVFGFAFNEGGFQAIEWPLPSVRGVRAFAVGPAPAGSLDATLAAAGLQVAAIDLRTLPKEGPVGKWFGVPRRTRLIGSMYNERGEANYFRPEIAPRIYDALLFVEKTTAARPNKSSNREAPQKLDRSANLDFEAGEPDQTPDSWITAPSMRGLGFESAVTGDQPYSGKRSAVLSRPSGEYYGESFGSLTQRIDATAYRGQHIRLRVMARTDAAGVGNQAYVGLEVARTGNLNADPIIRPVTSTTWGSYEIEVDVAAKTVAITYGIYLIGTGGVWMDAVSIEVVPKVGGRP